MSDYQGPQPVTGFLFPNKYHKAGDRQPCLKGTINVNGVELDVAVWAPKEGKKSYFMKISEKEDKNSGQPDQNQPQGWQDSKQPVQQQQLAPQQQPAERKKSLSGLMK